MPTCGQCQYGIMEKDVQTRVCHGGPPTPALTNKGVVGMRPIVKVVDRACCLFKEKEKSPENFAFDPLHQYKS